MTAALSSRVFEVAALATVLATSACGVSSRVVAERADYPISLSSGLRDADGTVLPAARKEKVGDFRMSYTPCSMLWKIVSFTGDKDISQKVNEQVKARGGDAVTNLSVSSGTTVWNLITFIGILPDCGSVHLAGDIVKVKPADAPAPVASATPVAPATPVTPATPATPATPVTPDAPVTPVAPEAPATPVTLEAPATPEAPVTPVTASP